MKSLLNKYFSDDEIDFQLTFFELGGTSIEAVQFINEYQNKTDIVLTPESLLNCSLEELISEFDRK